MPHVFASCSTKNSYSLALNIVRRHLNGAGLEHLPFPMTKDPQVLQAAWETNAARVLEVLDSGVDAAFVTLGDPLTYSTFGYLLKTLKRLCPEVRVVTIPGITSYTPRPPTPRYPRPKARNPSYWSPGPRAPPGCGKWWSNSDNIVMLKTYRNFEEIYQALEELDLLDRAVCISRCGLDGETVVENLRDFKGSLCPISPWSLSKRKVKVIEGHHPTTGGWGRWLVLLLVGLLFATYWLGLWPGAHHLSVHKIYRQMAWPLLRLLIYLGVGLLLGQAIESLGWAAKLGGWAAPLLRWGHLHKESGASFTAAFFSGILANTMLVTLYQEGSISRREMTITYLLNNALPVFLLHLPTTFSIIVPLTRQAGLIYLGLTLAAAVLRSALLLVYSRWRLPAEGGGEGEVPCRTPEKRRGCSGKSGKSSSGGFPGWFSTPCPFIC